MKQEQAQDEFKWYVVRAITGQEKKVKAMIESELDLAKAYSICARNLNTYAQRYTK